MSTPTRKRRRGVGPTARATPRKAFRRLNFSSPGQGNRRRPSTAVLARQVVQIGRGPVAPKTIVRLRYHDSWLHGAGKQDYVYRMNSIFDPDAQIGGHQPLGRDQYATFYNRYRVIACTMSLWVTPVGAMTSGYKIVILGDNNSAGASSPFPGIEQRGATVHIPTNAERTAGIFIKRSWKCRNVTGVTEKEYQDDRFQALMSTDPAEAIMIHIMPSLLTGGDIVVAELAYNIRLDYTVEMFDPLELASS